MNDKKLRLPTNCNMAGGGLGGLTSLLLHKYYGEGASENRLREGDVSQTSVVTTIIFLTVKFSWQPKIV